ncbi:coiled-coil domain-containing protein 27 [Hyperolius riggenbachi]|uniref:coiled-coil domain-containing protein 27 n=1 Tax=Hyperolius riggenbachi TaxID=752182 RepID=UPI0035A2FB2C
MVTNPNVDMKENTDWKMQSSHDLHWTGARRPQTAVWRIPRTDIRREKYSKSAQEPISPYEIQSTVAPSSVASSFESNISSQVIDLHISNGSHHGCYSLPLHTDQKLPHIHSTTDCHSRNTLSDVSSLSGQQSGHHSGQTYLTSVEIKTPWYITVLNEKERSLLKLGEEINRLSKYEVQSKRKDHIISTLRSEISQLQSDLQHTSNSHAKREEDGSSVEPLDHLSLHMINGSPENEEYSPFHNLSQEALDSRSSHRDVFTGSERNVSTISIAGSLSDAHRDSHSPHMEVESLHGDENTTPTEPTEDLPVIQEEEMPSAGSINLSEENTTAIIHELQEELQVVKRDYEISKGVISSLQRILSSHESKVRKAESEKAALQRELTERGIQLQAMSNKFSSMREERKHEEMMMTMEKENYNLRELLSELKSEMSRRNDMIADLKSEVQRLQKEILGYQAQMRRHEGEKSQIESKAEDLASSEQHVRVALETLQSRFERFRSKIIQAAYTAPGFKGPQAEISDNEILETMQKIIMERSDFHQQLKQKGVKVPPLHLSESSLVVKQPSITTRKKAQ